MVMSLLTRPKKSVATIVIATDGSGDFNCDGIADDVEIQAAIDSLPAGGGCIYMKEGDYLIEQSINLDIESLGIFGCGWATRIYTNNNIPMFHITQGHVTLSDFQIEGNGAGAINYGIYADNADELTIQNLWIHDTGYIGIYLYMSTDCVLNGNFIEETNCGISADGSGSLRFHDNFIKDAITSGVILYNTNDNLIDSNVIQECGSNGIYLLWSGYNVVSNNNIFSNGDNGLEIDGMEDVISKRGRNIIDGNLIRNNNINGIKITTKSDFDCVTSNALHNNSNYGISIETANCDVALISSNFINNNLNGAIRDLGTNTQVFNNREI